jgi:hypothetical protein
MTIVRTVCGRPYSSDFLTQLSEDLLELADRMDAAGCASARSSAVRKASRIARTVRDENGSEE